MRGASHSGCQLLRSSAEGQVRNGEWEPVKTRPPLTFVNAPHKAAVVGNGGVAARPVRPARNVPAEGRRPAALDGVHHLHLRVTEVALIGTTPSRAVIAEDLRNLQGWTVHVYRRLLRRVFLGGERGELIERAQHIAQNLARDVGVACRRVELRMAQSHLNHANIDTLLQKVGGERVPQRSFLPLPCSTRSTLRSESISDTLRLATSDTRRPAP